MPEKFMDFAVKKTKLQVLDFTDLLQSSNGVFKLLRLTARGRGGPSSQESLGVPPDSPQNVLG